MSWLLYRSSKYIAAASAATYGVTTHRWQHGHWGGVVVTNSQMVVVPLCALWLTAALPDWVPGALALLGLAAWHGLWFRLRGRTIIQRRRCLHFAFHDNKSNNVSHHPVVIAISITKYYSLQSSSERRGKIISTLWKYIYELLHMIIPYADIQKMLHPADPHNR